MRRPVAALAAFTTLFALWTGAVGQTQSVPARAAPAQAAQARGGKPASGTVPQRPAGLSGPWGVVTGVDDERGVPTFLWATPSTGPTRGFAASVDFETLAWHELGRLGFLYGLEGADLDAALVHHVMAPGRGGVLVTFRQEVGGLPVLGAALKLLFSPDGTLVAMAGSLRSGTRGAAGLAPGPGAGPAALQTAFDWAPEEALAEALTDRLGEDVAPADLVPFGPSLKGYQRYVLAGGLPGAQVLVRPPRIRPVLFGRAWGLVAAYEVELLARHVDTGAPSAWRVLVAAADGELLERQRLTFDASYRVWAAPDGLHDPSDGPLEDVAPHPTGSPDGFRPGWTAPILVDLDGFNTGPLGDPDPWLAPGETRTYGNNTRVFVDLVAPDGYDSGDTWGVTSGPGTFDWVYDASAMPFASTDQLHAGATQLFYTVNWLHDFFYDSGFDEAAGNAQTDNFGRGGIDGDPLIAQVEGKVEGFQNNASMSVLGDGESPFMQNGLWQASPALHADGRKIRARGAFFGASAYDVAGSLRRYLDGIAPATDACSAPTASISGTVVLIDRGACTFASKAERAQGAGALAAIIANNQPGESPQEMPNADPPLTVTIPVVSITYEEGQALQSALQAGPVNVTLSRASEIRQGALDSGVVSHEWGHYLHLRLVSCGNAQCYAMSEGFADLVAGFMIIREGDDPMGTYATGVYSFWHYPDAAYFGIRRVPYSADLAKNALSFRHIRDGEALPDTHPIETNSAANSEVHNAGEIWGTMTHDLYMALLGDTLGPTPRLTFPEARRRYADLLVLGMALAPQDPTFTEQRDALLAAASTFDQADLGLFAQAFARRGLGSCARAPARDSQTFSDLVESFTLAPGLRVDAITLDDLGASCDDDGILDAGETGRVVVSLQNTGAAPLVGATATVSCQSADVSFPNGGSATFGTIAPFDLGTATVAVTVGSGVSTSTEIEVSVTVQHAEACEPEVALVTLQRIHFDEVPASSASDDVESEHPVWTAGGTRSGIWERRAQGGTSDNHHWHVDDLGTFSDLWLQSPSLEVSPSAPFLVSFRHRHQFEQSDGTSWDGAVIELSRDDGETWDDVDIWADPGYGGVLTAQSGNPLGNRDAYVGESAGYPAWNTVILDLGTALAGEAVRLRFRVGSDQAAGEYGWDVDDIVFEGILNTPFPSVSENVRGCEQPFADAGPDQTVSPGAHVALDGSGSSDPQGDALTFQWAQRTGAAVTLQGADTATPSFVAPLVEDATTLVFGLLVSDGVNEDGDEVSITVDPATAGDGGVSPDGGESHLTPGRGCGCQTDPSGQGVGWILGLGLLLLLGLRQGRAEARRCSGAALIGLVVLLAGCGQVDQPGGSTLAYFTLPRAGAEAEFFTLPWPNDVRMDEDGTIDLAGFPADSPIVRKYVEVFDREVRGYSTNAGIFFRFDGPIDPASLPESPAHSLTAAATAYLVNIDPASPEYGLRTPVTAHFQEASSFYIGPDHLVLLPVAGFPLRPSTTYAAILTLGIRDTRGRPLRRDLDLVKVLSSTPQADPVLATAAEAYALLRSYVAEQGLTSTSILNAAVFTTQAIVEDMVALREAVYRDMPAPEPVPADLVYARDATASHYHVFEGTYEAPIYQAGEQPYSHEGGDFLWDEAGRPILQRTEPVRFALSVPYGTMPASGWPVVLYAHGTGGSFRSHLSAGVAGVLATLEVDGESLGGAAVIGIDQVLHGTRCGDASCVPELNFFNFQNPVAARNNVLQGGLDNVQLLRLVEAMNVPSAPTTGTPLRFDLSKILFMGHSQGSLTGPPFLAVEPKIPLAVLSGAGGGMILSLLQKTEPVNIPELLTILLEEPEGVDEFHPVLSLIQLFIDPSDPLSFGRYLVREPLPGIGAKHVYLSQGLIDHYVPPDLGESFAAALGLDLVEPRLAPTDRLALGLLLGTAPSEVDLTLLEGFAPLERPVAGNLHTGSVTGVMLQYQADEGHDGHYVVTDKPEARRDHAAFVGTYLRDGLPSLPTRQ